jgi:hypothetical protein
MSQALINSLIYGGGLPVQTATIIATETADSAPSRSVSIGLTAAGTTIANSLQLTSLVNVVSTAAASTGVRLPPNVSIGDSVIVQNNGANALNVFPPTASGTLNGGSAGAAVTVAAAAGNVCTRLSATDWLVAVFAKEA